MKTGNLCNWAARLLLGMTLVVLSQSASATSLPITFESPTYTTGNIVGQDGWTDPLTTLLPGLFSSDKIDVVTNGVITGVQSLRLTGGGVTIRQSATSGSIGTPTNLSWLVRVDESDGADFEAGLMNADFSTPIDIIFGNDGFLKYYLAGGQNFAGNPTYDTGTVYRVEVSGIDYTLDKYSVQIFDTTDNSVVASAFGLSTAADIASPVAAFVVLRGTGASSSAFLDHIFLEVPEPTTVTLGLAGAAMFVAVRRRRE